MENTYIDTYIIEEIVINTLKSQLFILPVVIFALVFARKKLSLEFQWRLHRGIMILPIIIFQKNYSGSGAEFIKTAEEAAAKLNEVIKNKFDLDVSNKSY